jgi:hypothetical protein
MRTHVRMAKALGAGLVTAGLLPAGAPAADADTTAPKPEPINLRSATVSGCEAPCAPDEAGQVTLTFDPPVRPPGVPAEAFTAISTRANGAGVHPFESSDGPGPWVRKLRICSESGPFIYPCQYQQHVDMRGAEVFTVTVSFHWDCDPISGNCESASQVSDPSNGLVPTQQ